MSKQPQILKAYQKEILSCKHFLTIDPGARYGGGTGIVLFDSFLGNIYPLKIWNVIGEKHQSHEEKVDHILLTIQYTIGSIKMPCVAFIEEPKFFSSYEGEAAAKSGALFKLIYFYGRLYQLLTILNFKVVPLRIIDWKGQLDKKKVEHRCKLQFKKWDTLWKGDVVDAIGMGLYLKGVF